MHDVRIFKLRESTIKLSKKPKCTFKFWFRKKRTLELLDKQPVENKNVISKLEKETAISEAETSNLVDK